MTGAVKGGESFTAGTKVLLANGKAVPIASLKPGEKVLATNTRTGKTRAETVSVVMVHHDTNLYDLKIKARGRTAVIGTTSNHPFWDATTHRWVKAAALRYGTRLRTPAGGTATVLGGHAPRDRTGWMWDLTVPGDHDFYIATTVADILVHNCDGKGLWQLTREGASAVKQGGPFNTTFYKSLSDGTWWTADAAKHGGSAFKVYEETSKGLQWISNADKSGDYIEGMWKGPVGKFIPWSSLRG